MEESCIDVVLGVDGDDAVICYDARCDTVQTTCFNIAPATGAIVRGHDKLPDRPMAVDPPVFDTATIPNERLRDRLAKREEPIVAAFDPTRQRLFEIERSYPTRGNTWNVRSGKRIARFGMDDFGGPPPPVSFDRVVWVGRHALVGDLDEDYVLAYDAFTGRQGLLFQATRIGSSELVVEINSSGRVDLRDLGQEGIPMIATRRIRANDRESGGSLIGKVVSVGKRAVVAIEDPQVIVIVDSAKRTVSRPRPLPRCK